MRLRRSLEELFMGLRLLGTLEAFAVPCTCGCSLHQPQVNIQKFIFSLVRCFVAQRSSKNLQIFAIFSGFSFKNSILEEIFTKFCQK